MRNLKNVPNIDFSVGIVGGKEFPLEVNSVPIEGNITIPPRTPKLQSLPYTEITTPAFSELVAVPPVYNYVIEDVLPVFPVIEKQECFLLTASGDNFIVNVKKNGVMVEAELEIGCFNYS